MALFGRTRDINLFKSVNRELMGDIITQQCAVYKYNLAQTRVNIYGEAASGRYLEGPYLFNVLIARQDQEYPQTEIGLDFKWGTEFRFLRQDLVDANIVMEVGDIILYQTGYYEVNSIKANQYFMGKNPDYPNDPNPLNPGLENFGANMAVICNTNYMPADILGITKERL